VNGAPVVKSTAAIFDSGTTLIIGDPAGIAKLFKAIDGAQSAGEGTYTSAFSSPTNQSTCIHITSILVPCTLKTPISMNVGGKEVSISPASFIRGRVSKNSDRCWAGAAANPTVTSSE
jgi:hypothetical protein